ncbi:hypothetical protein LTS08_008716 [Lithohypha guttulata]|uniref:Uncharacterized protein n=1 Tax=Lithohypha guttulata TaxID=1690604 RepID=A0AAN7T898_9EURO|nr:hypothetical protein LTR51_008349 [Lithohypha guttulata]KAK5091684.1 hypothetical protein LTR05_001869 [Lithohypha guttulata]KAK5094224.1 hypothetical protein LTS08_008716 [Lithohypha guttulata]
MSWMDSWSRPNKQSATPPPLYLTSEDVKYCLACGRVISDRKSHQKNNVVKYCSDGCRKRRVGPVDRKIDSTILALLNGQKESGIEKIDVKSRFRKGDHRNIIFCDEIEDIVFPGHSQKLAVAKPVAEATKEDDEDPYAIPNDEDLDSQGNRPNPAGPGLEETRREGQKRADEREMVRRAARRAVVFGFPIDTDEAPAQKPSEDGPRRKCEALMNGKVVEPSFAKGNWCIRWRE